MRKSRAPRQPRAWVKPLDVPDKIPADYAERMASVGHDLLERGIDCLNCKGEGFFSVDKSVRHEFGVKPCGSCHGKGLVMPSEAQEQERKPTLPNHASSLTPPWN